MELASLERALAKRPMFRSPNMRSEPRKRIETTDLRVNVGSVGRKPLMTFGGLFEKRLTIAHLPLANVWPHLHES